MADRHILIVGGTGMLRGATLHYVRQGFVVSTVARHRRRLDDLIKEAITLPGEVHPLPLDYGKSVFLQESLKQAISVHGPITTVISWIHSTAPDAPFVIADAVSHYCDRVLFYDILGSSSGDPSLVYPDRPEQFNRYSSIRYRRIVLGWIEEGGRRRWLTDEEISNGVVEAVGKGGEEYIVGTIGR